MPLLELAYVMDQRNRKGGKGQFQMNDLYKKVTYKRQESLDRKTKVKNQLHLSVLIMKILPRTHLLIPQRWKTFVTFSQDLMEV